MTVVEVQAAKVSFEVTGENPIYQWYYKNVGDSKFYLTNSFTSNSYSVIMTEARNGRQIYCVITDGDGNKVTTDTVTIAMKPSLSITKQPSNVTVSEGETAKVTFTTSGTDLTYEWYYKDANSSKFYKTTSFKSNTYSVIMNETRAGRQVYCVVTDGSGNKVTTNTVTLDMKPSLVITKQPVSVTVVEGQTAKVSFEVTGENLTYQWYYKDAGSSQFYPTSSFKSNSYSVIMNEARNGRQIYCVVIDEKGNSVLTNIVTIRMESAVQVLSVDEINTFSAGEAEIEEFIEFTDGYLENGESDTFIAGLFN